MMVFTVAYHSKSANAQKLDLSFFIKELGFFFFSTLKGFKDPENETETQVGEAIPANFDSPVG